MKRIAILALGTLIAVPAYAGGPLTPAAEPMVYAQAPAMPAPNGDWTGLYAGAQLGYGNIKSNGAGLDGNGAIGGLHAGYRYDFGKAVVGLGVDYDMSNIDLGTAGDTLDSVARVKLLAGYDAGATLLYATAGAAYANATVGGADLSDNGYFGGLGLDYALSNNWTIGGEVLMHKFDDFDASGVDFDATTVSAKVSYRF
ncbi:MAG: outer membrane beta-barrel protein [Paracoccaceae bacterium]